MLPYFRKLERDLNFPAGELHGSDGPVPIRRIMPEDWPPFCHAFADGLRANGFATLQDQNAEFSDGLFPGAFSNIDDKRVSTAVAYLDEATRKRPNLTVYSNLRVERIVMEGTAAQGVVAVAPNGEHVQLDANEVIVSAGALQSPALLMRAGIGSKHELDDLGIECLVNLPGVGRNLQDHPSLTFCHFLEPRFRMPLSRRRASMTAARFTSGVDGCDTSDLYLSSATRAAWHSLGNRLGLFFLWCNRPYSRGRVQLASPDAAVAPRVELNLLDDERDLERLAAGVRMLAKVVAASGLGHDQRDFFPAAFSPRVKALSRVGQGNALLTSMLGTLLDAPAPIRRLLIERFFMRGLQISALLADEAARSRTSSARMSSAYGMRAEHAAWATRASAAPSPIPKAACMERRACASLMHR